VSIQNPGAPPPPALGGRSPLDIRGEQLVADGRYRIERLLAKGGMSAVYLAEQTNLRRSVAFKILAPPPDADDGAAFEDRFRLEAETLAALDHRNVVTLYEYGQTEQGSFYLAMEFIDGVRLTDMIRKGPLEPRHAIRLMLQVCAALRYAHKQGVVHRDLKPSNLLIKTRDDGEEVVKVVDFGLVKLTESDQGLTKAGLILGSPHCMAPEQIKGIDVDHRADIYAIGVLLFRCVAGAFPFHGNSSAATMIAHLNETTPSFYSVRPDLMVPAGLEEVVRTCLQKDPAKRYPEVMSLVRDLESCLDVPSQAFESVAISGSSLSERISTITQSAEPDRQNQLRLAGLVIVLALIVAAYWYGQRGATPAPVDVPDRVVPTALPQPEPAVAVPVPEQAAEPAPPDVEAAGPPEPPPAPAVPAPATPAPVTEPQPVAEPVSEPAVDAVPAVESAPETAREAVVEDDAPKGYMPLPDDF